MKHRLTLLQSLALLLIAMVCTNSALAGSPVTPASLVSHFFAMRVVKNEGGTLDAGLQPELRPLISKRLYGLFKAARDFQVAWIARNPDQPSNNGRPPLVLKPPFVDGGLFTGSEDAVTQIDVSKESRRVGDQWQIRVRMRLEPGTKGWENTVIVIKEEGHYAIDEILYETSEGAKPSGSLSGFLKERVDG